MAWEKKVVTIYVNPKKEDPSSLGVFIEKHLNPTNKANDDFEVASVCSLSNQTADGGAFIVIVLQKNTCTDKKEP